jgi:hypothetical protein
MAFATIAVSNARHSRRTPSHCPKMGRSFGRKTLCWQCSLKSWPSVFQIGTVATAAAFRWHAKTIVSKRFRELLALGKYIAFDLQESQMQLKIREHLDTEAFNDPRKVELLKQQAIFFLEKMADHWVEVLSGRSDKVLSTATLEQFFRSRERNEQIGRTLQYLLAFLSHIPGPAEIEKEPVNPAAQFREFIRYQVDLLLEDDVKKAVFREINSLGSLNGGNVWDFQERIIEKNRELRELVAKDGGGMAQTIAGLCQVLEQLSLFWLEIKHGDVYRTRRSDLYLYSLSRIVKNRCQQTLNT